MVQAAEDGKQVGGHPVPPPSPLRRPPELKDLPWDLVETTFGFTGADLLTILSTLMVRLVHQAKDEKVGEKPLSEEVSRQVGETREKTSQGGKHLCSSAVTEQLARPQ